VKKIVCMFLVVFLSAGFGYAKKEKLTERQQEIAQFKKEKKEMVAGIKTYEDAIQNIKYRLAQLTALINYLESKEKEKKKDKKKEKKK